MDAFLIFKAIMAGVAVIASVIGVWILIELLRIVTQLRRLSDRVDFLTDLRSWGSLLRKLPRRK